MDYLDRFFRGLPGEQRELIRVFFQNHQQKSLQVGEVTWHYFDSETRGPALLLLHGGFADFSMWIHQIIAFEKDFRVIAPTCPVLPEATMASYTDALVMILDAERIRRFNLMGYSEGGLVAQCLLREAASRIDKAILAHTFHPNPEIKYYRYDFNLFRILPAPFTTMIFRMFAQPDKEELASQTEWQTWFRAYFKALKGSLTKPLILTHIDLMIDFVRRSHFLPEDLQDWPGQYLITVSADDAVFSYFDGMKNLYPKAITHIFPAGLGAHSIALISPKVFNQRIRQFLMA